MLFPICYSGYLQWYPEGPGSSHEGNSGFRGFEAEILRFSSPDLGDLRRNFGKPTPYLGDLRQRAKNAEISQKMAQFSAARGTGRDLRHQTAKKFGDLRPFWSIFPELPLCELPGACIPAYEMMCKGVAVMRRRSDSWLNATQILKVAGFDKPQRTRVLEREVQKGEHERFKKDTANIRVRAPTLCTWIPLDRGLAVAKQYECELLLRPIIEFQPAAKSPPFAPNHLVASTANCPAANDSLQGSPMVNTRSSRRQSIDVVDDESEHDPISARGSEDGSMTPSPSEALSSSRTPSDP
ncbi:transcription regulator HTH, apses-type DNA-binding domain-containing protein [Mycena capillaripes]|nr:transcription regulator HTH, apses-type DNA-binding domain-containing protein [Mycena capillaripes]